MNLKNVLAGICEVPHALTETQISAVTADSREVIPGAIFFSISGSQHNGEEFIAEAVKRGAIMVIASDGVSHESIEDLTTESGTVVPIQVVSEPRKALSRAASNFFATPSKKLSVIGITGTNGKTTSCWLLHQTLTALGSLTLRLGTAGNFLQGVLDEQSPLTTLDPVELHRNLALAAESDATHVVLEASSHALHQQRLADVELSVAIFTNFTRDHLDYHKTFEAYEEAKRGIFDLLKPDGFAVINIDDECGQRFAAYCSTIGRRVVTFGRSIGANVRIVRSASDVAGSAIALNFKGDEISVRTPLIGEFNAENVAGVFSALIAAGFEVSAIVDSLKLAHGAPGRLERIAEQGRIAFVDYAHSPDALERALLALRGITNGKLAVVFGCGGDRDRGKRPIMGQIAAKLADCVVITSDNPRSEDPQQIVNEIAAGAGGSAICEVDRAKAIAMAVSSLEPGDVLLIAGKGHENYQILGDKTVPFSDQSVAREALRERVL